MQSVPDLTPIPRVRIFNKAELADAFCVSLPTIEAWQRRGMPVVKVGGRGVSWEFDIFAVYAWRYEIDLSHEGTDDPEQMSPKERLDYYKGCRERDQHKKERGELVTAEEAADGWIEIIQIAKSRLLALQTKLAPRLLRAEKLREVEEILGGAIVDVLTEMADGIE